MNLSEYKFEIMLIVIVLVLALFWFAINFFDKKKPNHEFSPMNNNKVHMNGPGTYAVEKFQNNSPSLPTLPVNTPLPTPTPSNNNTAPPAPSSQPANNTQKNAQNNTQNNELVALSNNTVADFNSLSLEQLGQLKSQTRARGVLGLVTYDAPSDTLRIVSTKA
jgi:hypothetical protein